jgi:MFS family permease
MKNKSWILVVIVLTQFCGTSLWFAGNGVMANLLVDFSLKDSALAHLTSAVQLGFIIGTLFFALFTLADRFSPSKVFLISALIGSLFNLGIMWSGNTWFSLIVFRFLTGFFLAGVYPVGMKIAADHFTKGLGKSLGFLVGALVIGTAFPHFLKAYANDLPWKYVVLFISCLASAGGILMYLLVPDGPHRKKAQKPDFAVIFKVFRVPEFRSAAFGYFGHMWELYAFWAFIPIILQYYNQIHPGTNLSISVWSFTIIGIGGVACVIAGYLAQQKGTKRIAILALSLSCICCIFSPLAFSFDSSYLFLIFLLIWGMVVIADSPLFSTLVANNASPEFKGTALTIVNCIGFSITIISIQLLNFLYTALNPSYIFIFLAAGPLLGLKELIDRPIKSVQVRDKA